MSDDEDVQILMVVSDPSPQYPFDDDDAADEDVLVLDEQGWTAVNGQDEPVRQRLLQAFGITDAAALEQGPEIDRDLVDDGDSDDDLEMTTPRTNVEPIPDRPWVSHLLNSARLDPLYWSTSTSASGPTTSSSSSSSASTFPDDESMKYVISHWCTTLLSPSATIDPEPTDDLCMVCCGPEDGVNNLLFRLSACSTLGCYGGLAHKPCWAAWWRTTDWPTCLICPKQPKL